MGLAIEALRTNTPTQEIELDCKKPYFLLLHIRPYKHFPGTSSEPIGIEQLAGTLLEHQVPVNVSLGIIETAEERDEILDYINKSRDNIIGLSMPVGTWEDGLVLVNGIEGIISDQKIDRQVLIGGNLPTNLPEETLRQLVNRYPFITIVRGWGDSPLVQLLTPKRDKTDNRESIPGLVYMDHSGTVRINALRQGTRITPGKPVRTLLNKAMLPNVVDGEDCPWHRCTFCPRPPYAEEEIWHPRPPNQISGQIIDIAEMGRDFAAFTGEESLGITADHARRHVLPLVNAIKEIKRDQLVPDGFGFALSTRSDAIIHTHSLGLLKELQKAGLKRVFIGIESGVPSDFQRWDNLAIPTQGKRYNKGIDLETHLEALQILHVLGIDFEIGFIILDPLVDLGEILESAEFLIDNTLTPYVTGVLNKLRLQAGSSYGHMMDILLNRLTDSRSILAEPQLKNEFDVSRAITNYHYLHPLVEAIDGLVFSPELQISNISVVLKGWERRFYGSQEGQAITTTLQTLREQRLRLIIDLIHWVQDELKIQNTPLEKYDVLAKGFEHQPGVIQVASDYRKRRQNLLRTLADSNLPKAASKEILANID